MALAVSRFMLTEFTPAPGAAMALAVSRFMLTTLVFSYSLLTAIAQPQTKAERTRYAETSTHADVLGFCQDLAAKDKRVVYTSFGQSTEGKTLPLLILADPPVAAVADAKGRPVVLAFANIHAGEVDGKEAVQMLARDLVANNSDLLKKMVILIAPNFNPDGNEKFSADNRRSQNGPPSVGVRENAQGRDLNRDFVKLETAECRALVKLMNEWDPLVTIDCHTTNGSYHRYTLTYDGPRYPAADTKLIDYTHEQLLPAVAKAVKASTGFETFLYGNFDNSRTKWESYPAGPRFGVQYVPLRGRICILSESYSYASFEDRVKASYAFVKCIFEHVATNVKEIQTLCEAALAKKTELAIRSRTVAYSRNVSVLGYENVGRAEGKVKLGPAKDYPVELMAKMEGTLSATMGFAYVIPSQYTKAADTLRRHGITVEELLEDVTIPVEAAMVEKLDRAARPFQGVNLVNNVTTKKTVTTRKILAGSYLVKTNQRFGNLATYLLEAESEDGLTTWGFFDAGLAAGAEFPVLKLTAETPLHTGPLAPLPENTKPKGPITFADVEAGLQLGGAPMGRVNWLDAEHFLQVREGKLQKINARTGMGEVFVDPAKVKASLDAVTGLDAVQLGIAARSTTYRMNSKRTKALFIISNDIVIANFDGTPALRLTTDGKAKEVVLLSPTGDHVSYVQDSNLFCVDLAKKEVKKLTTDGGGLIINGRGDWVYEEEIFNRNPQAYWWSPDGTIIAFLRFDDTPVKPFTVTHFNEVRSNPEQILYPKAGDPNPTVKIGVANANGGDVKFLNLDGYKPEDMVISRLGWVPGKNIPYAQVQNRIQTWMDFCTWPEADKKPVVLFRDSTKAWIEDAGEPKWLKDGSFIFFSERTGWKHLYHYAADGKLIRALTTGEYEVKSLDRALEDEGYVYFTGTKDGLLKTNFYRVKFDGTGFERLTTGNFSHAVSLAPSGPLYTDRFSDVSTPPKTILAEVGKAEPVRNLDTNPARERDRFAMGKVERVTMKLKDGYELEGSVTYPVNFDEKKKYPVWLMTYAGPHAPTIRDEYGRGGAGDQAYAAKGIIIFRVDPRSASGKGAVSAWACYKQLGVQELKDLEEAVAWLAAKGWVDTTRVGISGHSYGGFMTAYALTHSKVFSAGISGAPVLDWHLYDSIYTERYMDVPANNKEGYEKTSVVKAAKNLHGKLLLIHGMIDDNVHVQNSMQFIDALQRAGKSFELMVYPRSRHGINAPAHYPKLMNDFILKTMAEEKK